MDEADMGISHILRRKASLPDTVPDRFLKRREFQADKGILRGEVNSGPSFRDMDQVAACCPLFNGVKDLLQTGLPRGIVHLLCHVPRRGVDGRKIRLRIVRQDLRIRFVDLDQAGNFLSLIDSQILRAAGVPDQPYLPVAVGGIIRIGVVIALDQRRPPGRRLHLCKILDQVAGKGILRLVQRIFPLIRDLHFFFIQVRSLRSRSPPFKAVVPGHPVFIRLPQLEEVVLHMGMKIQETRIDHAAVIKPDHISLLPLIRCDLCDPSVFDRKDPLL